MTRTILAIAAHPDDLDFTCAGTMSKFAREGNRVEQLIISDGSKGVHKVGFGGARLARIREGEQKKAAKILGVKSVRFMKRRDGSIENTEPLRKALVKAIRACKPDVVLSFDPASLQFDNFYRSHRDHRQAAESVFDAIYPAVGSSAFYPGINEKPHQIQEMWFYATHDPNMHMDISNEMDAKVQALLCHESQITDSDELRKMIDDWAKKEAKGIKMKYAESFRRISF